MTAKSRDMAECGIVGQGRHHLFRSDKSAQGHTSAKAFGQDKNIGGDPVFHKSEHGSQASEGRLDLIEDQQGPGFVTTFPQFCEEMVLRGDHAGFGLHDFSHHTGCGGGDLIEVFGIVVTQQARTGKQGPEGRFVGIRRP